MHDEFVFCGIAGTSHLGSADPLLANGQTLRVNAIFVFVTEEKTQTMRIPAMTGVLAVLVLAASAVNAADIKSGLQVGDPIVTYTGEKCGGIVDGIAVGRNLCYT